MLQFIGDEIGPSSAHDGSPRHADAAGHAAAPDESPPRYLERPLRAAERAAGIGIHTRHHHRRSIGGNERCEAACALVGDAVVILASRPGANKSSGTVALVSGATRTGLDRPTASRLCRRCG